MNEEYVELIGKIHNDDGTIDIVFVDKDGNMKLAKNCVPKSIESFTTDIDSLVTEHEMIWSEGAKYDSVLDVTPSDSKYPQLAKLANNSLDYLKMVRGFKNGK